MWQYSEFGQSKYSGKRSLKIQLPMAFRQPPWQHTHTFQSGDTVLILRYAFDQQATQILSSFEEPGKIDLADFMEQNFMFNLPLEKFGYQRLTEINSILRESSSGKVTFG